MLIQELFTERWDYSEVQTGPEPIAGNYSSKTNIWGMASIMFTLLIIEDRSPTESNILGANDPWGPFLPGIINGAPALGPAWGWDLQNLTLYSVTLRNLVTECLYENPAHRPTLENLKRQVMAGLTAARLADPTAEPYADFLPYDDPTLVDQRAGIPAPLAPLTRAMTPAQLIDMFGGKPTLPNPALNGFKLLCRAIDLQIISGRPKPCRTSFVTDGIEGKCRRHRP